MEASLQQIAKAGTKPEVLLSEGSFVVELELACCLACLILVDRDLDLFGTCVLEFVDV